MDTVTNSIFEEIKSEISTLPEDQRYLVGIGGFPGSGKSSFTKHLTDKFTNSSIKTVAISMDGWHYTRDDPTAAFARRGAPHTFDAEAYTEFVQSLKLEPRVALEAPTFSHSLKDPTPNGTQVDTSVKVVIIEGNYVLLNEERWMKAANNLDKKIWVDIDEETTRQRLIKRHVESGICKDSQEAYDRAENNDLDNGRYARQNLVPDTQIIKSIEDEKFAI
ncbi:P-loop containing nucleoside triphosphate hydrolase protein [Wallemia mellicola]|uniref:P-loop containing nucleoside triphosphate hydrolase protein n=1 Tax=Wallemia mellicola TaxID=1708541 RepID=A0A4T0NN04_9BASI|nr:P-loop containing nucleoside triphosphate hydrolase protein [Wallemia mellicola]